MKNARINSKRSNGNKNCKLNKRKNIKRVLFPVALLIFGIGIFCGCGSNEPSSDIVKSDLELSLQDNYDFCGDESDAYLTLVDNIEGKWLDERNSNSLFGNDYFIITDQAEDLFTIQSTNYNLKETVYLYTDLETFEEEGRLLFTNETSDHSTQVELIKHDDSYTLQYYTDYNDTDFNFNSYATIGFKEDVDSDNEGADSENEEENQSRADYILPESDSKYLEMSDLSCLTTEEECRLAINEIYARHGFIFENNEIDLREYFSAFNWYEPTISPEDFDDSMLNEYEIANRDLILSLYLTLGH